MLLYDGEDGSPCSCVTPTHFGSTAARSAISQAMFNSLHAAQACAHARAKVVGAILMHSARGRSCLEVLLFTPEHTDTPTLISTFPSLIFTMSTWLTLHQHLHVTDAVWDVLPDITEEWRHHPAFAQLASVPVDITIDLSIFFIRIETVSDTNDVGEFDTRLDIHELGDNLGARDLNQVPNINDVADWIDTRLYIEELGDNLGARDDFIPYDDEGEGSLAGSLSSLNSSSWGDDQNHLS
ncbi:hypothetical protein Bbelb_049210 [Branchiostoma belcheri]|nr:hypothetical protein Bbelb_049210 [Branchiostoma belcheri]